MLAYYGPWQPKWSLTSTTCLSTKTRPFPIRWLAPVNFESNIFLIYTPQLQSWVSLLRSTPMKMELLISSETSVLKAQTPGDYPEDTIRDVNFFRKSVEKIQNSLIPDKNNRYFTWRSIQIFDHISLSSSRNETYFRQNCREVQNTHFLSSNCFFQKWNRLWDNVEIYCRDEQDTWRYNKAHALCIMGT